MKLRIFYGCVVAAVQLSSSGVCVVAAVQLSTVVYVWLVVVYVLVAVVVVYVWLQ